jgi:hypothetical protein
MASEENPTETLIELMMLIILLVALATIMIAFISGPEQAKAFIETLFGIFG